MLKATQPRDRRVRVEEVGDGLELSYRKRPWIGACFFLVWLTAWSAGCIRLIQQTLADPGMRNILFAIPFIAAWFFVFFMLVWMLFGAERVRLGIDGLEYRTTALVTMSRRTVPREELKRVSASAVECQVDRLGHASQIEPCLRFETRGRPIDFAPGISAKEQRWLVEWLNQYLDTLRPHGLAERQRSGENRRKRGARAEVLQPEATPVEPLSDSQIEVHHHWDTIEFVWRGRWSPAAIAGLSFLHLFWNGLTSVFVYQLVQAFQWSLFFLLIPFEALGLFFFASWLLALTASAWRWTWMFGEWEAVKHIRGFGLSRIKRFGIESPVRIELQTAKGDGRRGSLGFLLSHPDGGHTLSFNSGDGKELLEINWLTEGDARWMADVLFRAFPSWSRHERSTAP